MDSNNQTWEVKTRPKLMLMYFGPKQRAETVGKRAKLPQNVPKMAQIQIKNMALPPNGVAFRVSRREHMMPHRISIVVYKHSNTSHCHP
jgi:hypothetical protein